MGRIGRHKSKETSRKQKYMGGMRKGGWGESAFSYDKLRRRARTQVKEVIEEQIPVFDYCADCDGYE